VKFAKLKTHFIKLACYRKS